jgi:hypothetical protein
LTFTKWGGHPHWDGAGLTYRGEDDHGLWLVAEEGTVFSRPGAEFATHGRQVMLLPSIGRWFTATFYEPVGGYRWRVYVDICTPPAVRVLDDGSGVVSSVDLDLDVVQGFDGSVGVEDEDEFAEHQGRYGYPPEVVDSAATECRRVVVDLQSGASWACEELVAAWRSR